MASDFWRFISAYVRVTIMFLKHWMCSLREIELLLGHGTHEKSIPKSLPMNESLKAEV